jgi:hypothetical protein
LLFHYLPELEAHRAEAAVDSVGNSKSFEALDLLINTIKKSYRSTTERLTPLLEEGKVTYDLLWALFKANGHVISICPGSSKPRCLRYDMGEEKKTHQGVEYFELQCQYIDFDGKVFGVVVEKLAIEKFRGAREINILNVFPLKFHPTPNMKEILATRGERFINLMGSHHRHYDGHAFFRREDGLVRVSVNSRIMIDAEQFRKSNPSYPRLFTKKSGSIMDLCFGLSSSTDQADSERVKSNGVDRGNLNNDNLLICSPTLLGFSLSDKFWGEAIADLVYDARTDIRMQESTQWMILDPLIGPPYPLPV